jgi:hypothetical protein
VPSQEHPPQKGPCADPRCSVWPAREPHSVPRSPLVALGDARAACPTAALARFLTSLGDRPRPAGPRIQPAPRPRDVGDRGLTYAPSAGSSVETRGVQYVPLPHVQHPVSPPPLWQAGQYARTIRSCVQTTHRHRGSGGGPKTPAACRTYRRGLSDAVMPPPPSLGTPPSSPRPALQFRWSLGVRGARVRVGGGLGGVRQPLPGWPA